MQTLSKPKRSRRRRQYIPIALLGTSIVVIGAGTFAMVRNFLKNPAPPAKQVVQEIHLIRPPPPPPDLPPPPPPPPEEKVDVPQPKPEPAQSNDPPPGQQLGLDADASAGGDAFGLLANRGGRDLLATGGSAFAWYAGLLKDQILSQLNEDRAARGGDYSLVVQVWVGGDGTINRIRVSQGSGDHTRDQAVEQALSHLGRLNQSPPAEMPQPISLRIVSRG